MQIGKLHVQLELDDPDKGRILSQAKAGRGALRKNRLYLDTCITEDQMVTKEYLSGVHQSERPLKLNTNAGISTTDQWRYIGFSVFWLNESGLSNVVLVQQQQERHCQTNGSYWILQMKRHM